MRPYMRFPMLQRLYRKIQGEKPARHRHRPHHFLAAWIRSPLKMGALLPSSRALARAMAAEVDIDKPGMIVELGAGTGVMTHALLQAGVPGSRLVVLERDRKL